MSEPSIFLPKDHPDMPTSVGLEIEFLDGKKEKFEATEWLYNKEWDTFEICTNEDKWFWLKFSEIKSFSWDKKFSKMVEINREFLAKNKELNK